MTYDLTHSLQHSHLALNEKGKTVIDDRYWFNKALSLRILDADLPSGFQQDHKDNCW